MSYDSGKTWWRLFTDWLASPPVMTVFKELAEWDESQMPGDKPKEESAEVSLPEDISEDTEMCAMPDITPIIKNSST